MSLRGMVESLEAEAHLDKVMSIATELESVLSNRPIVAATLAVGIVISRLYERRAHLEAQAADKRRLILNDPEDGA